MQHGQHTQLIPAYHTIISSTTSHHELLPTQPRRNSHHHIRLHTRETRRQNNNGTSNVILHMVRRRQGCHPRAQIQDQRRNEGTVRCTIAEICGIGESE